MSKNCFQKKSKKSEEVLELAKFLKILSDANRLRIVCFLEKKEQCVCEIFKALDLPQNLVSHHLARLEELCLVEKRKEGTFIIYRLNEKVLKEVGSLFNHIIKG